MESPGNSKFLLSATRVTSEPVLLVFEPRPPAEATGVQFGRVFRTDDGGRTWREQRTPTSSGISDLAFVDREVGWAVGAAGTILHTTNGGRTWWSQDAGVVNNLFVISALDREHAWLAGQRGIIARYVGR